MNEPLAVVKDGLEIYESWADAGIEMRRSAGQFKTQCPKCGPTRKNPRDPSLSVNVDTGMWNCHNDQCGWKGKLDDKSYVRSNDRTRRKDYIRPAPIQVKTDKPDKVREFFENRAIPWHVVEEAKVSWGYSKMPQHEGDVFTIQFPFYVDNELLNVKYRGPNKTFRMVRDAELTWYGMDWCIGADTVYIVEGEMDALALRTIDKPVMSVPNGAPSVDSRTYTQHFDFVASGEQILKNASRVVIAVDGDQAGRRLADELARRIGKEKCWRVFWPDDHKDANDVLMSFGEAVLREIVESPDPWPVEGLVMPLDLWEEVLQYWERGLDPGVLPGWPSLDKMYRPAIGQMTTVTGIPSHGKSSFVEALMVNIAREYGWRFGLCSPEHWPPERCLARLCTIYTGKPLRTNAYADGMSKDELRSAMEWAQDRFRLILPNTLSLPEILKRAELLAFRDGIRGLVLDPWTSLEHHMPKGMREDQYIAASLSDTRAFARNHGMHLWWIAHPTKQQPYESAQNGEMPVVGPYSIKGGTAWADFSDYVISIHRNTRDSSAPTSVHIQKVRFHDNGETGVVKLRHDRYTGRYIDEATGESTSRRSMSLSEQVRGYQRVGEAVKSE